MLETSRSASSYTPFKTRVYSLGMGQTSPESVGSWLSLPSAIPSMFPGAYQELRVCGTLQSSAIAKRNRYNFSCSDCATATSIVKYPFEARKTHMSRNIGRREFLMTAFATSVLRSAYSKGSASGLREATLLGPEADAVNSNEVVNPLVTPNGDFFIRNHFTAPAIRKDKWSLEISGMVTKPLKMSYSDLLLLSSVRWPITLECAGNFSGGPGVSTAMWTGVT